MDDLVEPVRPPRPAFSEVIDRDWVLALSLAFFVAVVVWFGHSVKEFFGPSASDVLVPSFSGQTLSDAQSECERLKVQCTVAARQTSDRFPQDVVMGQQPAPGSRVREGRAVSMIVSTGVTIFPMPDLRFESLRNVNLELAHRRLRLAKTRTVANDDIPADHVVSQDPIPLTSVREGSDVTITLSKGPPSAIKVPNFVNSNLDGARGMAQQSKIHLGQIVWTPFGPKGPARGVVVRQAPAAGSTIDAFTPVSLQVSAGPTEYGYIVRQTHVTATIPARDNAAHVRMEVRDDTGTWNVYDSYAQGGQKIDLNVTAIGTSELDTYIDNELLSSTKIGVEPPLPHPSTPPEKKR